MLKNLSSDDVSVILKAVGITLRRRGKEDVFTGENRDRMRVVIVPRNKKSIPAGTLSSIWRQAGLSKEEAEEIWKQQ